MFWLLTIFIFFISCAPPPPVLIYQSPTVGDGGRLVREIYRSSWTLPSSDTDLVRIGIIDSKQTIRFKALYPMRIRALGENSSWEVSSPEGVRWVVESEGFSRPGIISYYAVVSSRYFKNTPPINDHELLLWKDRGYLSTRWVGPPKMDVEVKNSHFERWMIALTPPTSEEIAEKTCSDVKDKYVVACYMVGRVELPPLAKGKVYAERSNFSRDFEGFVEILSPRGPVEVEDLSQDLVSGEISQTKYGPRLLILPAVNRLLTLIQQTSLQNYLDGVVASEIFPQAHPEALKAQAIVARTYTLRYGKPDQVLKPFFICAGTQCQAYRGSDLKDLGPSQAVQDTANQVLVTPQKKLAITFYHSICGGRTDSRSVIFGEENTSYLEGISDYVSPPKFSLQSDSDLRLYLKEPPVAYCGLSSFAMKDRWRWNSHLDSSQINQLLDRLQLKPPLLDINVSKRSLSGRILSLEFVTETGKKALSGELQIRQVLGGLRSSQMVFNFIRNGKQITQVDIEGGAYGHGVGMCQVGAIGRAEHGQFAKEILQAYFPGTSIDDFDRVVVE